MCVVLHEGEMARAVGVGMLECTKDLEDLGHGGLARGKEDCERRNVSRVL